MNRLLPMTTYRIDSDLVFLRNCDNEDLDLLVSLLTHDPKDNSLRWSETLTGTDEYKCHFPNHQMYWKSVAAELQTFGANSIVSLLRGKRGVLYREILIDVCEKMKVNFNKKASTETIEMHMLMKVLEKSLQDMPSEQLTALANNIHVDVSKATPEILIMAIQAAIRTSGFAAYQMALIVANSVAKSVLGKGLSFATNALLTRSMSLFAGPIGWIVSSTWLVSDLAGPAYRVTVPACILVAYMRQKAMYGEQ